MTRQAADPAARRRAAAERRKAAGGLAADLVELFLAEHVRHMAGPWAGRPFLLEPWQRDRIVRPIFGTLDARGDRKYREALIGLPRWGGKSEIAAALALACMFTEPVYEGEYIVVARNRPQASIVFNKAKRMVLQDDYLRSVAHPYRSSIVIEETGSVFRTLPWDAAGAQGIHAQVAVIDEYHVHRDPSMRHAILSGMIGTRNGLLITISTAGGDRKGPLWDLLGTIDKDPRAYKFWAGAADDDDGHDPRVWRAANPQSWVTMQQLKDAHRTLPFPEFERYHLNRFPTAGTNRAYSGTLWWACGDRPQIDPERPSILGLDASLTRDTTALVLDQVGADHYHNALAWTWGAGRPMGDIDHEAIEAKVVELCEDYNVTRVVCDKSYFTRSMRRLEGLGIPVEEYPQTSERMALASMGLYDVLLEGRMRHGGDPDLTEAVLNCAVKPTPWGWRVTKPADNAKIDAAVALIMAAYLGEAESERRPIAEGGGVWSLEL